MNARLTTIFAGTRRLTASRPAPSQGLAFLRLLPAAGLFLGLCTAASAERDPFWPIGYEPPKPEPVVTEAPPRPVAKAPAAPVHPAAPTVKPVSESEWKAAKKELVVSGFTQSVRPDTGEKRTQVMINRRTYMAGDTLAVTNDNICFVWRIEALADRDLTLKPVSAARLPAGR
jgi:hypothetical protein